MECNSTLPTKSLTKTLQTRLLPLLALVMTMGNLSAQLSGTITVPSTAYPTLQNVVDSLNTYGISAAVTVNVTAGNTQYPLASRNGIQLGSATLNSSMSASKTITFNGNGNIVYAYTGTRQLTSTGYLGSGLVDAMFVIKGTDYVTINDFAFRDTSSNTTATTAMEYAIALYNASGATGSMDGCQNVNITNCSFNMTNLYNTASTAYCTYAIFGGPFLYGSSTQLSWSDNSERHRMVTIDNNTMTEGLGFADIRGVNQDYRARRINIRNNTVFKAGGPSVVQYGAISPTYCDTVDISNNIVHQDPGQSTTYYGLWVYYCAAQDIINNTINFNKTTTAATTNYGIYAYGYNYSSEATNSYYRIKRNEFNWSTNSAVTTTTSNTFYGIYHYSYNYNWSSGVWVDAFTQLDSNKIENDTIQGSGTFYAFFALNATTSSRAKFYARNNVVNNVLRTGFVGTTAPFYMYNWADTAEIAYNVANNIRWDGLLSSGSTAGTFYGFYGYFPATTSQPLIHDNVWSNCGFRTASTASNTLYGFYIASTTYNLRFFNNKMHNFYITPTSAGGGNLYGMYLASGTTNTHIYNNVIDSLRISNNGTAFATANVSGIYHVSSGDMTCYNNYIGELYSLNSNSTANVGTAITGIWASSTASCNLYNNTIRFGTASTPLTSNGATFGGSGIAVNSGTHIIRNNIININATPGSTGGTFSALRYLTAGTAGVKPTNISASHNIYFVRNTNNNYIYSQGAAGTASASLINRFQNNSASFNGTYDAGFNGACGLYKTFMQEASTFSEDNLNNAGSVANTLRPAGTTYSESAGLPITSPPITTDLSGASRTSTPDRGALEFAATALDATGPTTSFAPVTSILCTTAPNFSVTMTDLSGVNTTSGTKPRMYFKKSTETDTFLGNTSATSGWKYVEATNSTSPFTFTPNYSLLTSAVAIGDVIQYFFVSQDNVSTPNVSITSAALSPAGSCPTSVNLGATMTKATAGFSYTLSSAPTFMTILTPTSSCMGDTIKHQVAISNPGASCPTGYGASNATTTADEEIHEVTLGSWSNNSGCAGAAPSTWPAGGCFNLPVSSVSMYSNYTNGSSPLPVPDIVAGSTQSWSLKLGYTTGNGTAYSFGYAIFIDFNRNGTFEVPDERVVLSPALITSPTGCNFTTVSGNFTVPVTGVLSGPTLMRVVQIESNATPPPTGTYGYGETEDYMVNLIATPDPATTTYSWTSNKTGATVLGTTNPMSHATVDTNTIYTSVVTINGCPFNVLDTVLANPLPKRLQVFNTSQCGGGIPTCKVRDSNGFSSPVINWYANATSSTPLQSGTDTTYTSSITSTTTFYVSIQNPSTGCWSPRSAITATVTPADTFNARGNGLTDSVRVCSGSPVSLTITNVSNVGQTGGVFTSFAWSCTNPNSGITSTLTNGTGTQTITPSAGGDYVLTATASNTNTPPCRNVKYLKLSVQDNPFSAGSSFITTSPNPACIGVPVTHTLYLAAPNASFPNYSGLGSNGRPTYNSYWDIDSFQLNNYVNVSTCAGGGSATAVNTLPASVTNVYSNYTNNGSIETLLGGTSANWKIVMNNSIGNSYPLAYAIYIDYNRDGAFNTTTERAAYLGTAVTMSSASTTCGPYPAFTGSFTVPSNVVSGPALMRVMGSYSTVLTSATINYSYGETEDYIVNLVGPADTTVTKLAWRSNQTGTSVLGNDKTLVHALPAATTYYNVSMNNGVCIDTARDTVTNSVPALSTTSISGTTSACVGEPILLSTSTTGGCIPYSYNWATTGAGSFTNVGSSANNDSIIFNPSGATGSRTVNLTVTGNNGATVTSTITIGFNNPVPTATGTTICGTKTATISATPAVSSDIINWYTSASSFYPINTGTTFTTPVLTGETVYWVREFSSLLDSCHQRPGYYTYTNMYNNYGIRVQALKRVVLNTIDFHGGTTGASASTPATASIDIGIYDDITGVEVGSSGSQTIQIPQAFPSTTSTSSKVPVGVALNPGTYRIYPKAWTNITYGDYYYNATPFMPSAASSTASGNFKVINGILAGTLYTNYSMYFWNPIVEEGCWGAAVPDTVKFQAPPALTISKKSDSVCSGSSTSPVTLTSTASSFNTYTWTPSANISGSSATGWAFSEPTVGSYTYILGGVQTSGLLCAAQDTFKLKVKTIPSAIQRNPASANMAICNGTIVPMDAYSGSSISGKVGTGTISNAGTVTSPMATGWMDQRVQYLYTAAELAALGIQSGSKIDSVGFFCTANSTTITAFNNYTVSLGNTTATSLSSFLGSLTQFYTQSSMPLPATGTLKTFPPNSNTFTYNGGNLVVEICLDHNAYTGSLAIESSTVGFTGTYGIYQDVSAGNLCTSTTANGPITSTTRPNLYIYQTIKNPITWSPVTGLYTNSGATTAYTGNAKDSVWAKPNDTTIYSITATHSNGCPIKDSIQINVTDTLNITSQPAANTTYCIGDTIRLTAAASSTSPMTRQWRKNGTPINPTTNASAATNTLVIPITSVADSGSYTIQYSTGAPCSPKISQVAIVKVKTPPVITTQPASKTEVCEGSAATFTVSANNLFSYQWRKNGTDISGANSSSYTISNTATSDAGIYTVALTGNSPCASLISSNDTLVVTPLAAITTQPTGFTVCQGSSASLTVAASNAATYQWFRNGSAISGATGATYNITNAQAADSANYTVTVYSANAGATACASTTSTSVLGVVKTKQAITTQPASLTQTCEGSSSTFTVTASLATGYQWKRNGSPISGANASTYTISNTAISDAGIYTVEINGNAPCASITSADDTLVVTPLAAITGQPSGFAICQGSNASLTVTASNAATYQWLKNGSAISGATGATYSITNAQPSDSANYSVIVYSANAGATACASTTSSTVLGSVRTKEAITTQPASKTQTCEGSASSFTVTASNATGYQWMKNGSPISGANSPSFSISNTATSDAGIYTVVISGNSPCADIVSTNDTLVVTPLAAITGQPTGFTLCQGSNASMTVAATNAATYQWMRNGSAISGATGATFNITGVQPTDSANYSVVVYSANAGATACASTTSSSVLGSVIRSIVISTQPAANTDVCENSAYNVSVVAQNATAYQWKKGGSNVTNGTGANTSAYMISPSALGDAGNYTVEITGNAPCPNVTSNVNIMKVTPLAGIYAQPTAQTVCVSQTLTMNTAAATNASGYQWFLNGSPISGATSSTYGPITAQKSDSGNYTLVAYSANGCKPDTSVSVLSKVISPISITTQPAASSYGCIGAAFSLNIAADNVTSYAWTKNGSSVGTNANTFSVSPFSYSDTGTYSITMTGITPCPNVVSNNAIVLPTTAAFVSTEPVNTDVCVGNSTTLTVVGQAAQTYQWRKNGSNISGATSNTYTIPTSAYADTGMYDVIAIAYFGCTNDTSVAAKLIVSTPFSLASTMPKAITLCESQTINLSTSTTGTGSRTYAWTRNGTPVGTNSSSFSKTSVLVADAGKYEVAITGSPACPTVKDSSLITINMSPTVTIQPNSNSPVCIGQTMTVSATAANSSGLDWYKQGTGIVGSGNSYSKSAVLTDAGVYYAVAKPLPACTNTTSSTTTVVVNKPVIVLSDPQGASLVENPPASHTMTIGIDGTGPFTYQWRKNGVNIAGATSSSYTINNYIASVHSGNYDCIVRTSAPCSNADTSGIAIIGTMTCPVINTQPVALTNVCKDQPFSLDVKAGGAKSYQWFKDGQPIPNATSSNYSISFADLSDAGLYQVEVIAYTPATCPTTLSDKATVAIKPQAVITTQPMPNASCAATVHTMSVVAQNGDTYQWYRNGIAITPGGNSSSYTYNNVNSLGDNFKVEIGNSLCPSVVSNTVLVKTINPATKATLATKSMYDLVERCTDNLGWTYYSPSTQSDEIMLAIKKNGNAVTASPDIELMKGIREISPINVEQRGAILGSRIFNLDFSSTITKAYEVKFYYSKAEENAVMNRWKDIRAAAGTFFSSNRTDTISFITTTQNAFTSNLWSNLTIPLNVTNTIAHTDRVYGVDNNVNYVILKSLVATKGGGTMFMDYTLKSGDGNSAIANINANGFGFNLYPIPTTDGNVTVEVSSKRMKPLTFTITDMTGRRIAQFEEKHLAKDSKHQFDFSSLANGNYQIQVANDEESMIGKFTISK